MDRFYLPPTSWDEPLSLTGDEAHHCRRVLRKKVGDRMEIFDGAGVSAKVLITAISSGAVSLEAQTRSESPELSPAIEVAVGVPKGKSFDRIIQKAVEMGVASIQPLVTEQGNVRINDRDQSTKQEKWQRVALEACKQCGQNFLPKVQPVTEISSWLEQKREGSRIVAALQPGVKPMRTLLEEQESPVAVTLLIGPEGDFSSQEYLAISAAGFLPVSLGNLVLRTETAVMWMIAAVRYRFSV